VSDKIRFWELLVGGHKREAATTGQLGKLYFYSFFNELFKRMDIILLKVRWD
jgi:hypothetical protein